MPVLMFGSWVLTEIWIKDLSSALVGMLMSSSKLLFFFFFERSLFKLRCATVIGIVLCYSHQVNVNACQFPPRPSPLLPFPPPRINVELSLQPKRAIISIIEMGRSGLNVSFKLTKTVACNAGEFIRASQYIYPQPGTL